MNGRLLSAWRMFGIWGFTLASIMPLPAQSNATFSPLQVLTNQEVLWSLQAPTGVYYRVEASLDLTQWQGLAVLRSAGTNQQIDSGAPFLPHRFYRAVQLPGTNWVTGDCLATANGDVMIHPIRHAGLLMTWNGTAIYVDPTNAFADLPRANLILITHDHADHLSQAAISNVMSTPVALVAPQVVYSKLSSYLANSTAVLTNGMQTNLLGIGIEAVPMYNTNSSPSHAKGTGNGYILTLGCQRIYLSGDTHNIPEMSGFTNLAAAFLAMNQYTMNVTQAVLAVRSLKPAVVYPNHFKNANGTLTDLNSFKQQVLTNPAAEVRLRNWY
jgi:L-ascorbate metabolism protein UlaG (beta-lactamase superfamily)